MSFNSSLPDDGVNIPQENPLIFALKLLFSLAILIAVFYTILRLSIDLIATNLPLSYEKKLSSLVLVDLNISDASSSKYLDELSTALSRCADVGYDVKTYIISQPDPNAFALPGGVIYITDSMLDKLESQNELVMILAHEMGHFKNRDHLKGFGNAMIIYLISLILGESYGGVLDISLNISNAKFSQQAEFESDLFALDVMECAYGNVADATELFKRLDGGDSWRYFLASHPTFQDRIDRMDSHIQKHGYTLEAEVVPLKEF